MLSWFRRPTPQFMQLNPVDSKEDRIPADMWHKCPECNHIQLKKDFYAALSVCTSCGRHERLRAADRIAQLVDPGTFEEFDRNLVAADPLQFEDKRKYADYVAASRKKSGVNDAVTSGRALMGGTPVSLAVFDFAFMGGSMGSVVGEKVTRAMERSLKERIPCITVVATGGARMQEGILSLMQMAKTSLLCHQLDRARIPFVVVLADPSTAGVMASFASLGDVIIAEPRAYIGFAGKRVIEQTIKQQLPPNFQTSEFQQDHGFVDMVVHRKDLRLAIIRVLRHLLLLEPHVEPSTEAPEQANPDVPTRMAPPSPVVLAAREAGVELPAPKPKATPKASTGRR